VYDLLPARWRRRNPGRAARKLLQPPGGRLSTRCTRVGKWSRHIRCGHLAAACRTVVALMSVQPCRSNDTNRKMISRPNALCLA
jgi:hypothetical protein